MRAPWHLCAVGIILLICNGFAAETFVHNFVMHAPKVPDIMGQEALYIIAAIVVVAILLWLYARVMRQRSVLE